VSNKTGRFSVQVSGIRYDEFAQLKWQQFLRLFSVAVMLVLAVVLVLVYTGRISGELPVSGVAALVLILLALLAVFRSGIRQEYKRAELAKLDVTYTFDRDGWSVKNVKGRVDIPWNRTWRVKRGNKSLLLYHNKKSVYLVPLRYLTSEQLSAIIGWCSGAKKYLYKRFAPCRKTGSFFLDRAFFIC